MQASWRAVPEAVVRLNPQSLAKPDPQAAPTEGQGGRLTCSLPATAQALGGTGPCRPLGGESSTGTARAIAAARRALMPGVHRRPVLRAAGARPRRLPSGPATRGAVHKETSFGMRADRAEHKRSWPSQRREVDAMLVTELSRWRRGAAAPLCKSASSGHESAHAGRGGDGKRRVWTACKPGNPTATLTPATKQLRCTNALRPTDTVQRCCVPSCTVSQHRMCRVR